MTEQDYEGAHVLWDEIMGSVETVIKEKVTDKRLSADQIQFLYEKCTEDLYHAGWKAIENLAPSQTVSNEALMESSGTDYDSELRRLRNADEN